MSARSAIRTANIARLISLAVGLSILAGAAYAQSSSIDDPHVAPNIAAEAGQPEATLGAPALRTRSKPMRVDVDLVLVPVTVTDAYNRPVVDLPRQDFTVYEGGVAQPIRYFSNEDAPISVGLILDCSGSMREQDRVRAGGPGRVLQVRKPAGRLFRYLGFQPS